MRGGNLLYIAVSVGGICLGDVLGQRQSGHEVAEMLDNTFHLLHVRKKK